jgi:hypothetical protein
MRVARCCSDDAARSRLCSAGVAVSRFLKAIRRASSVLDVPGTPRSLRLDDVTIDGDVVVVGWSFADPESWIEEPVPHGRRIHGELEVPSLPDDRYEAARACWTSVQLDAGYRFKSQVDADWMPGEPYVRRVWTPDEAWQGLLAFLGHDGAEIRNEHGELHVVYGAEETTYRIDPDDWAAYLTDPDTQQDAEDSDIVPAAFPQVDGLPLWVTDELYEIAGTHGVIALEDGQLRGVAIQKHPTQESL